MTKNGFIVGLTISVDVPHFTIYLSKNENHVKFADPMFGIINILIKKFISEKNTNTYRWKIVQSEFKKYLKQISEEDIPKQFLEKDYHKHFIAFKKNGI